MNGVYSSIRAKTKNFFDIENAKFDKDEIQEMVESVKLIENLGSSESIGQIVSGANEIDDSCSDLTRQIKTAKSLCEINNLPKHFTNAFTEILERAIETVEEIGEFTNGIREETDCLESLFTNALNAD